jgi:RNA polymerase-binding transcription factor DksA
VATTGQERARLVHQPGGRAEDAACDEVLTARSRLADGERHALDGIVVALARLRTPPDGMCEGRGRELPVARLRAMPAAGHCLAGQTAREASAR